VVEKSKRRDSDLDRAGIQLFLIGQIKLIVTDVFEAQNRWGFAEMPGEHGNLLNVTTLRQG
jgi:hypothetical protein